VKKTRKLTCFFLPAMASGTRKRKQQNEALAQALADEAKVPIVAPLVMTPPPVVGVGDVEAAWGRWMAQLAQADVTYGSAQAKAAPGARAIEVHIKPIVQASHDGLGIDYIMGSTDTFLAYFRHGPGAVPWVRRYWFPPGADDDAAVARVLMPLDPEDQATLVMHGANFEVRVGRKDEQQTGEPKAADATIDYPELMRAQLSQLREIATRLEAQCTQNDVLLSTRHDANTSKTLNADGSPFSYEPRHLAHFRTHLLAHQARQLVPPFCRAELHAQLADLLEQARALLPPAPVRRARI
jgi:hypothetical protein